MLIEEVADLSECLFRLRSAVVELILRVRLTLKDLQIAGRSAEGGHDPTLKTRISSLVTGHWSARRDGRQ
jgi:hypothetical protein